MGRLHSITKCCNELLKFEQEYLVKNMRLFFNQDMIQSNFFNIKTINLSFFDFLCNVEILILPRNVICMRLLYGVMPQVVGSKTIVQWIQLSVELLLTS